MLKEASQQGANDPRKRTISPIILLFLILSFTALACDLNDILGGGKPNAIITSPPSGSTFHEGEDIAVQSVSTDSKGIARVELLVDGEVVRTDTSPTPQDQFTLVQTWRATQGNHTLLVRAYNTQNSGSDPAAISIQVAPAIAGGPTAAPGVPTVTSATGVPSITPLPGGCTNNSAFAADVTIPDGTTINGGQTFNKIWRLSNNGTCTWGAGYQFVFASGEAMSPNTVIAVPSTAPGATADLLVPMTAPTAGGQHSGNWRLRSSGGALFGATVSVKINVPGAPPPATNTPVPAGCSGNPVIASFTASPNPVASGATVTLNWGAVTNADSVDINQSIGGVGTPGSTTVTPSSTTTYTMTAHCGSNVTTSSVTVTVTTFSGHWDTNFGPMDLTQTGSSITGTYSHYGGGCTGGTISGTVTGSTLDGTWGNCGSGTIHFVMAGGGVRWDGNWGGSNKWCAARSGVALAAGCGFSGHWNLNTAGNPPNTADLTQIGNTVTGSYGTGGTITSATVTAWTLNGTWNINAQSNSFTWVIDSAGNLYFRGNYSPGSTAWCGWRDGQSQPSTCHN
jgi:Ig-like domain-containing protein/Big-like domain-containing protein